MIRQQYEIQQPVILAAKEEHEILDKYHRAILEHQDKLHTIDRNIFIKDCVAKLQKYNPKWNKKEVTQYFKNAEKKNKKALLSSNPSLIQYQHDNTQGGNAMNPMQMAPRQGSMIPNPFQSNTNMLTPQQMQAFSQGQQKPSKKSKKEAEEASKTNINPTQFYPPNMANGDQNNQQALMKQFPQQFTQPANNGQMQKLQMGQTPQFNPQFQGFQAAQVDKKSKKSKDDKLRAPQQMPNQMQINGQPSQGQVQMPQQPSLNTFQMGNPTQPVMLNNMAQPPQKGKRKSKKEEKAQMAQNTMINQAMFQMNPQQQQMMASNMTGGAKMGFGVPMQQSQQQIPLNQTPSQMMQMQNQMQPKVMQQPSQQMMQFPSGGMMQQNVQNPTFINIPQTAPKRSPKSKRGQQQAQEAQINEFQQESLIHPPEAKPAQKAEQSPKNKKQRKQADSTKQKTRSSSRRQKVIDSNNDDDEEEEEE